MAELAHEQQTSAVYWLVNGEGRRAVFNDPSDPDYCGGLVGEDGVTGLDAAEVRQSLEDVPEGIGSIFGAADFPGSRPVTMQAAVTSQIASTIDARATILQRIARASKSFGALGSAQLIWFPGDPAVVATTRQNLIQDGSFEYDVVGNAPGVIVTGQTGYGMLPTAPWTDQSDAAWTTRTFAVAAANPAFGSNSLRIKGTKDATATDRYFIVGTPNIPVIAGRQYSMKASVFIADAPVTGGTYVQIRWFDPNGNLISQTSSTAIAAGVTGAQTMTLNGATAPAGAVNAQAQFVSHSLTSGDGVDLYLDGVIMEQGASAGNYLDGDTANCSWLGLRGFSASVNRPNGRYLTVRRQQPLRSTGGFNKTVFIPLVAADPRIYSTVQYRLSAVQFIATAENQGDWEAPILWRLWGAVNAGYHQLTIPQQGVAKLIKTLTTIPTLAVNHFEEFDEFTGAVRLDPTVPGLGGTDEYGYVDFAATTWPGLVPGLNAGIRFDSSGGAAASSFHEIRWRDTWL